MRSENVRSHERPRLMLAPCARKSSARSSRMSRPECAAISAFARAFCNVGSRVFRMTRGCLSPSRIDDGQDSGASANPFPASSSTTSSASASSAAISEIALLRSAGPANPAKRRIRQGMSCLGFSPPNRSSEAFAWTALARASSSAVRLYVITSSPATSRRKSSQEQCISGKGYGARLRASFPAQAVRGRRRHLIVELVNPDVTCNDDSLWFRCHIDPGACDSTTARRSMASTETGASPTVHVGGGPAKSLLYAPCQAQHPGVWAHVSWRGFVLLERGSIENQQVTRRCVNREPGPTARRHRVFRCCIGLRHEDAPHWGNSWAFFVASTQTHSRCGSCSRCPNCGGRS